MKRFICLTLSLLLILTTLCSCKNEQTGIYLPKTIKCFSKEGVLSYTISYTYSDSGKIVTESGNYEGNSYRNYTDMYAYNEKDEPVSLTKISANEETVYNAEKITDYKYIFKAEDQRTITIIFDDKGHIVSTKTGDGYVSEYAYTYDKNGKPTSIKHLRVNPSGSNKLFEYRVEFTSKTSYNYYDKADDSYYMTADCIFKK